MASFLRNTYPHIQSLHLYHRRAAVSLTWPSVFSPTCPHPRPALTPASGCGMSARGPWWASAQAWGGSARCQGHTTVSRSSAAASWPRGAGRTLGAWPPRAKDWWATLGPWTASPGPGLESGLSRPAQTRWPRSGIKYSLNNNSCTHCIFIDSWYDEFVIANNQVWDWRSRRVSLNINSKKGGQWEDSFGAVKKSSKDQALFSDPVNKAQMFYMDNLLLAVSSNRLFMFNINLPERGQDKNQTEDCEG